MSKRMIFVNYRRADAPLAATFLFTLLEDAFGREQLFKDVDNLRAGQRFPRELKKALTASDVFIAVIGPKWLDVKTADGQRRLDQANDYERMEIEQALAEDKVVIPVLVDGGRLPAAHQLPESMRELIDCHGLTLSPDGFPTDVARLIEDIRHALDERDRAPRSPGRR